MSEDTSTENPVVAPLPESQKPKPVKLIAGVAAAVIIIGGGFTVSSKADSAAEEKVNDLVQKIEAQADNGMKITYGKVNASILNSSVTVDDVSFNAVDGNPVFAISSLKLAAKGYVENKSFPTSLDVAVRDFKIVSEEALNDIKEDMNLDYSGHTIDASFGYQFVEKSDTLSPYINLAVSDLNEVSFQGTVSSVKGIWNAIEANYAANDGKIDFERKEGRKVQKMMPHIGINELSFTYANKGEMEVLFEKAASENGMSVEEMKAEIPGFIDLYLEDVEFADDLKAFVANPKQLSFSVTPEKPLTAEDISERFMMAAMGSAETAFEGINLKVKAN